MDARQGGRTSGERCEVGDGGMRGEDVSARARNPLCACPPRSPRRRLGLLPGLGAVPVRVVQACHHDEVELHIAEELP